MKTDNLARQQQLINELEERVSALMRANRMLQDQAYRNEWAYRHAMEYLYSHCGPYKKYQGTLARLNTELQKVFSGASWKHIGL